MMAAHAEKLKAARTAHAQEEFIEAAELYEAIRTDPAPEEDVTSEIDAFVAEMRALSATRSRSLYHETAGALAILLKTADAYDRYARSCFKMGDIGGATFVIHASGDRGADHLRRGELIEGADFFAAGRGGTERQPRPSMDSVEASNIRYLGYLLTAATHDPAALDVLKGRYGIPAEPGGGIMLIKPWGVGFWGEVFHVVSQLVLAEGLGRTPIVYWNQDCRYWQEGMDNAWHFYFQPIDGAGLDAVLSARTFCPPCFDAGNVLTLPVNTYTGVYRNGVSTLANLRCAADVLVADGYNDLTEVLRWVPANHRFAKMSPDAVIREMFRDRIRLRADLQAEVEAQAARLPPRKIAVHYRTPSPVKLVEAVGNKVIEIDDYWEPLDGMLAAMPDAAIFLLTDFLPAISQFQERYRDRVHLIADAMRIVRSEEIEVTFRHQIGGYQLAMDVIRDCYLAARCDAFLGDGASAVSCVITYLKDWQDGTVRLLRDNVFCAMRPKTYS